MQIIEYIKQDTVIAKINDSVKDSKSFQLTVISLANQQKALAGCEPESVLQACLLADSLALPVNGNLGYSYILPYGKKAQFQMGYKGFIQLALRSGQFERLQAVAVYQGQLISRNPVTGYQFDWNIEPAGEPVGYYAFFKLKDGFFAELYMTQQEIQTHAKKFSQSFQRGQGVWVSNFKAMAEKTVIKLLLSKYAPLSVELQTAIQADQSEIKDAINGEYRYIDNEQTASQPAGKSKAERVKDRAYAVLEPLRTPDEIAKKTQELVSLMPEYKAEIISVSDYLIDEINHQNELQELAAQSHSDDECPF